MGMRLVAPGLSMVLTGVVPVNTSGAWVDSLARIGLTALGINFAYYAALAYGGLAIASGLRQKRL